MQNIPLGLRNSRVTVEYLNKLTFVKTRWTEPKQKAQLCWMEKIPTYNNQDKKTEVLHRALSSRCTISTCVSHFLTPKPVCNWDETTCLKSIEAMQWGGATRVPGEDNRVTPAGSQLIVIYKEMHTRGLRVVMALQLTTCPDPFWSINDVKSCAKTCIQTHVSGSVDQTHRLKILSSNTDPWYDLLL